MPFAPLKGVRVLALEQAVSMPYATFVLAELGAEIIKIERPGSGDVIRGWDSAVDGLSTGFVWVNSGKRSLTLDVSKPEGKDVLFKLLETADVFVENLAPGSATRLGYGPDDLTERFPQLVYCCLSGFGAEGPYGGVKSYDLTIQAESGILLTNGYPGMPAKVGLPITDLIAGANAIIGIQGALMERNTTGKGRVLDVTMLDSALLWTGYYPHHAWHSGTQPPLSGMHHQYIVPYGPYMASDDKYICYAVGNDAQWKTFCEIVIEKPEWVDDPRIATIALRKENRDIAEPMIADIIASKTQDYWAKRLSDAGIPFGLVRTMNEVVEHPQAIERNMFVKTDSPVGELPLIRFPLADADRARKLPELGGDTEAILAEIGLTTAQIESLQNNGLV